MLATTTLPNSATPAAILYYVSCLLMCDTVPCEMLSSRKSLTATFHRTLVVFAAFHLAKRVVCIPSVVSTSRYSTSIPVRFLGFENIVSVSVDDLFHVNVSDYEISCKLQTGIHKPSSDFGLCSVNYLKNPVWKTQFLDLKNFALDKVNHVKKLSHQNKYVYMPTSFYCIILGGDVEVNPGPVDNSIDEVCDCCGQVFLSNSRKLPCSDCGGVASSQVF